MDEVKVDEAIVKGFGFYDCVLLTRNSKLKFNSIKNVFSPILSTGRRGR